MNKKILAILLAALMLLPLLAACSSGTENAGQDQTGTGSDTQTQPSSTENGGEEQDETARIEPNVPASDFGGADFVISCTSNTEYGPAQDDFFAEEITGEPINDARRQRNITVGDKLNINIVDIRGGAGASRADVSEGSNAIMQSVQAGTADYDLATAGGYATSSLALKGYLYDINTVPYIDLSAPWWDQVGNKDLQILGQLFYTTGDISTADNDATYCIMFNKQLVEDYHLQNPYELVYADKWTMENFIGMATSVYEDLNANGEFCTGTTNFDIEDRFGALIWDDSMMGVVNCTGEKCCSVNDEGLLEFTLNTEKTVDAVTRFLDFASQKQYACTYQRVIWEDTGLITMFSNNQGLFLMQLIQIVPKMREMDANFGILPYFKFDESQQNYYTTIGSWHSVFLCVPNGVKDIERTGIVTECLANEGLYTLTPAYYEKTLVGKSTRDQESSGMLDIIFANRVFDMGWYYAVGGWNEGVMNLLRNYNNNMASQLKSTEKVCKKTIEKTNDSFLKAYEAAHGN